MGAGVLGSVRRRQCAVINQMIREGLSEMSNLSQDLNKE